MERPHFILPPLQGEEIISWNFSTQRLRRHRSKNNAVAIASSLRSSQ
jgi:hypothetical protein